MTEARGRAVVGVGPEGTLGGTVGDALSDLEDRAHTHTVGPINVSTSVQSAHVHAVVPLPVGSVMTSYFDSGTARVELVTDSSAYIVGVARHRHGFQFLADGFAAAPAGEHAHRVAASPIQSTVARTSQVMPYIQLLACRKG